MSGFRSTIPVMLNFPKRPPLSIAVAIAAVLGTPMMSIAQEATTPSSSDDISTIDTVVVTGSARAQRRFDASYAANSLTAEELQKLAPKSYADLLANVPGIHVESTGGEVQNITRLRGIPTDRGYIIF